MMAPLRRADKLLPFILFYVHKGCAKRCCLTRRPRPDGGGRRGSGAARGGFLPRAVVLHMDAS